MSERYKQIRMYYKYGMWTKAMVKQAVRKGWITEAEYEEIVGNQ